VNGTRAPAAISNVDTVALFSLTVDAGVRKTIASGPAVATCASSRRRTEGTIRP
jgi:hypothetical protein